jgi:predicted phage-related endonuclease
MKPEIVICDQGGDAWQTGKLGVPSVSNFYRAIAKKGSETRNGYIMELVGQIATKTFDEINGKALEHGRNNEAAARAAFEFETGKKVHQVGMIYGPNRRYLCSPDGLIGDDEGLEIKSPLTARVHADFLCNQKVKSEYEIQVNGSMWVSKRKAWHFCSFHPAFKTKLIGIKTFEPDRELFERLDNEIPSFLKDLDEALAKIGLAWGDQWR